MDILIELLTNTFGIDESEINRYKTLEDMGLDSICIVELQVEIERKLSKKDGSLTLINTDTLDSILIKLDNI
ncbi:acyl carrier protein [Salmonella enterica subsp. enterica serovar Newport]|uniref:Acyl carrier protein n=1 Tax=Salmonella enterica TaxID=28901 RepID=A0A754E460_SALER|nr:acyl carrier protein [Salmonella enterica]ECU9163822.1 acyl carrier protein [Salmonella enterica subsp. enterica serovar Newport str. CFSAN000599]EDU1197086.1 acyl carrier protein [Salmonella enterica subsp. enterica serovar Heidelberg str. CFSAN000576]HAF4829275.1 acyl carrier protein [Salmonella enterica]HAF8579623.1 acyl carrier protein [Salmonella enterica]